MSKLFSAPAIVAKVETMSDGGCKLRVDTAELNPEAMSSLFNLKGTQGYFLFSESAEIDTKDIPEVSVDLEAGEKSPSKRLRNVLWVYWEENTSKKKPFDVFYRESIEKLITDLKDKLN